MIGRASTSIIFTLIVVALPGCSRSVDGYTFAGNAPWCIASALRPRDGQPINVRCEWLSEQHCQAGKALSEQSGTCVPNPLF